MLRFPRQTFHLRAKRPLLNPHRSFTWSKTPDNATHACQPFNKLQLPQYIVEDEIERSQQQQSTDLVQTSLQASVTHSNSTEGDNEAGKAWECATGAALTWLPDTAPAHSWGGITVWLHLW
ncbi:hypothetical protein J1614_009809 [Plenodomus biglobosus]|nr:hypothetical protein J1614_009809 [Plenodomus biglobosus]